MDTTSNNGRHSHPKDKDFLSHEMEVTKVAIQKTAGEIWEHVPTTDDVAAWTKANPMLAVGIAAGAGVLAGFMVTPSRSRHYAPRSAYRDGSGSILGSIAGAVMPSLSTALSEAGRTALSAAVAHFTSQQVAQDTAQETAEETTQQHANGAYAAGPSSPEAA